MAQAVSYDFLIASRYGCGMFGRQQAIFRSRWRAAFWASGILLTAYCTVPSQDETDSPSHTAEAKHSNPWAVDPARR